MLKYEIILYWSDIDQVVIAEVPELPGGKTHGDTYEEALAMAQDAMRGWIEVCAGSRKAHSRAQGPAVDVRLSFRDSLHLEGRRTEKPMRADTAVMTFCGGTQA